MNNFKFYTDGEYRDTVALNFSTQEQYGSFLEYNDNGNGNNLLLLNDGYNNSIASSIVKKIIVYDEKIDDARISRISSKLLNNVKLYGNFNA